MADHQEDSGRIPAHDTGIIRPEVRDGGIRMRTGTVSGNRAKKIRKGLTTLHTLELMATNIYRFQISRRPDELNRSLTAAMLNEMTHFQDFQVKLYEYGWRPSPLRFAYWIVGFMFGFLSRLAGRKAILRTGIWVESKAVRHYAELLERIDWDEETRKVVEKNQADEFGHIERWRGMLGESAQQGRPIQ